jgi:hypothetical protein
VAFLGFFLMGSAWSFAAPYDGPADEIQHTVRAYGLISGQLADKEVHAPFGLFGVGADCARWHHDKSYACVPQPGSHPGDAVSDYRSTTASSYPPFYYVAVGLPIKLMPDMRGVIGARLLTDAIMAALLAASVGVAGRLRSMRWLVPAIFVVATPVVVNLAGSVNPSGVEIACGIGLWTALIAIIDTRDVSRGIAALAAVGASGLAMVRGFGLGWLLAVLVIAAVGLSRPHLRTVLRAREMRIASCFAGVAVLLALIWHFVYAAPIITAGTQTVKLSNLQIVVAELWDRVPYYQAGLTSLASYGDIPYPSVINTVWTMAAGFFIVGALAVGTWRERIRIVGVIAAGYLALIIADYSAIKNGFWESQGRYALPLLVGAPLLAASVLHRRTEISDFQWSRLGRVLAVVLVPVNILVLTTAMVRWQRGQSDQMPVKINPLVGDWTPVWGSVFPLVLMVLGVAVTVVLAFVNPAERIEGRAAVPEPRMTGELPVPDVLHANS